MNDYLNAETNLLEVIESHRNITIVIVIALFNPYGYNMIHYDTYII